MMQTPAHIPLTRRAVLRLSGNDLKDFLQGIITNQMDKLRGGAGLYSALLTPQGKYLADFFLVRGPSGLFLDVDQSQKDMLIERLTLYRLKSNVTIEDLSEAFQVWAHLGAAPGPGFGAEVVYADPRLADLGWRSVSAVAVSSQATGSETEYETLRLALGVPDCPRDCEPGKSTAYEGNLDLLNGLSFTKGCYVGQEVTARMQYRGKIKKRLMPVEVEGPLPAPGTGIFAGHRAVGQIRSGLGSRAMALLRIDRLDVAPFTTSDGTGILPVKPDWLSLD